ncbi:MAG: HEAT repeat domain-containing protein [Betaproteobacteria bacterium]
MRFDQSLATVPDRVETLSWLPHDPLLALVFQFGLLIIACSMLMLVAVFVLRIRLVLRQRREKRFAAAWQPLLAECVYQVPETLPQVPRAMRYHFLKLWNYHHESLVGSARKNLEQLAYTLKLEEISRVLLHQSDLRSKLIAIVTLGHLGDRTQWHELRALVADPSPMLSLAAVRALLDIDAGATLTWLVTVMASREDWPLARIVAMLKEAGPGRVTLPLIAATEAAAGVEGDARQVVRLLRMMEVAHTERIGAVVGRIVRAATDPEVVAAGLRLIQDPHDLELVRSHLAHESWFVRVSAVRVLGRIGEPADRVVLTDMLGDRHWWVRYHAARALIALPFTSLADLEIIRAGLPDRFAADMLGQAIAEARAA